MGAQCMCSVVEHSEGILSPAEGGNNASASRDKAGSGLELNTSLKPKPSYGHFDEEYLLPDPTDGILGHSPICTVVKTRHRSSSKVHAVKQICKRKVEGELWRGEIQAMTALDHPNICKVHDTWEDAMNIYMAMEFCRGGQLTGLGGESEEKVNESTIAVLVRQMVDAVAHLHQHNVVHSDIRPENWLFEEKIEDGQRPLDTQLKMVDFGFASKYGKSRAPSRLLQASQVQVRGKLGSAAASANVDRSLFCKAPEQIAIFGQQASPSGEVGTVSEQTSAEKADVWALGVIAYFLLSGQPPFTGPPEKDDLFKSASYVFMPSELWRPVSSEAKNFIAMCLQEEPMDRPRAEKIMNLPWMGLAKRALEDNAEMRRLKMWPPPDNFKASAKLSLTDPPLPSAERVKSTFARMNQLNVLEKAAVIAAAHRLQENKIADLCKAYEAMDKNKEGFINTQEFFEGLESCGVPCKELAVLIQGIEVNGSRMIEYPDFVAAIQDFQTNMQDSAVWAVFRNFDSEGGKAVLKKNLVEACQKTDQRRTLATNFPELPLENILEDLDNDGNGMIQFEEFKNILRRSTTSTGTVLSGPSPNKLLERV